jgi:hypothetical protein
VAIETRSAVFPFQADFPQATIGVLQKIHHRQQRPVFGLIYATRLILIKPVYNGFVQSGLFDPVYIFLYFPVLFLIVQATILYSGKGFGVADT